MHDLYRPGNSLFHRMHAGHKVLCLVFAGSTIFLVSNLITLIAALVMITFCYRLAGLSLSDAYQQLRPVVVVLLLILIVQGLIHSWTLGFTVIARFAFLLLAAGLLTLTTRVSDMITTIESNLHWLRPIGVNPGKVSLAISLTLRFIPVMRRVTTEVREAQKVRGLERNLPALAIPVITRMLKMSDDISDALDARGYDPH